MGSDSAENWGSNGSVLFGVFLSISLMAVLPIASRNDHSIVSVDSWIAVYRLFSADQKPYVLNCSTHSPAIATRNCDSP